MNLKDSVISNMQQYIARLEAELTPAQIDKASKGAAQNLDSLPIYRELLTNTREELKEAKKEIEKLGKTVSCLKKVIKALRK
jgi:hypothetical protein